MRKLKGSTQGRKRSRLTCGPLHGWKQSSSLDCVKSKHSLKGIAAALLPVPCCMTVQQHLHHTDSHLYLLSLDCTNATGPRSDTENCSNDHKTHGSKGLTLTQTSNSCASWCSCRPISIPRASMTAALMAGRFRHARNAGFLLHCVICMSTWKEKTLLEGQYPQQLHQLGLLQAQLKLQSLCDGCADGGPVQAR